MSQSFLAIKPDGKQREGDCIASEQKQNVKSEPFDAIMRKETNQAISLNLSRCTRAYFISHLIRCCGDRGYRKGDGRIHNGDERSRTTAEHLFVRG